MYFAAAPIWNEIARTQKLRTQWAKDRFSMDCDQISEAFDKEAEHLDAAGINSTVVHSYLTVKPLLLENVAISHFIMDTGRDLLRMALPEICTVDEAVMIADMDRNGAMTDVQQKQLADLLKASLTGSKSKDFISCVLRKDFDSALKTIKTGNKGKKPFNLNMTFKKSSLRFETPVACIEIPLTAVVGSPKSTLTFPGHVLLSLYGTWPTTDSLHLSLAGDKFKIEKLSLSCSVAEVVTQSTAKHAIDKASTGGEMHSITFSPN